MLQNAYFLAKIGADTAENERNFAKNWQLPYGSNAVVGLASSTRSRSTLFSISNQKTKRREFGSAWVLYQCPAYLGVCCTLGTRIP